MADLRKIDVKFSADMLLKLIEKFNGEYSEELNSFEEGEALELLSAQELSTKLYKNYGVDVERVRAVLNKDTLSQTDLVSLAYFATEITNETPSGETRKRSGADADGTSNKKRKKTGRRIHCKLILICFKKVKSTDMLHECGLIGCCKFYWKMSVKVAMVSGVFCCIYTCI